MSSIKTEKEIEILKEGGKRLAFILNESKKMIKPGISTFELDKFINKLIHEQGGEPSFLNYRPESFSEPYPASACISINDEIVHGVPKKDKIIKEGDLVSVDVGLKYKGLITDSALTVSVGEVNDELKKLLQATEEGLYAGIRVAKEGNTIGDIGNAISNIANKYGFTVFKELVGHGVGYEVHEEPLIPNFGHKGKGEELRKGMVIALEPMFSLGSGEIVTGDDGFTYKSKDGSTSAHFEHTIVITSDKPEVITN